MLEKMPNKFKAGLHIVIILVYRLKSKFVLYFKIIKYFSQGWNNPTCIFLSLVHDYVFYITFNIKIQKIAGRVVLFIFQLACFI